MTKTKFSLVGAGPGDPELITIKALKAIQSADVILYDALSSEALLEYKKDGAIAVYVGKRCGKHSIKQGDINMLIAQFVKTHKHVIRLKGGDPFVFGRGHEELVSLRKFDVDIEVIPGISSVTSLPLLQEVPLTRRHVAESFWVLTGTTKDHDLSEDIKLAVHSNATVVILMGMRKIQEIGSLFAQSGKGDTPAMVISKGATPNEKVVLGNASNIAEKVIAQKIPTPGIIVIGETVGLHPNYVKEKIASEWAM